MRLRQYAKYLVIAGEVMSRSDGEIHYISGERLCHLYGVDPALCRFYTEDDVRRGLFPEPQPGQIVLRPRFDGNYKVPI